MKWFLIIHSALSINWFLDSGYYFSTKNKKNTLELGLMWGSEYKLNHEMIDHSIYLSVPYADPGKFYIQKAHDASLSLEITQTWKINDDSWEMIFEGQHKPKNQFDKNPKLINVIIFGGVLNGFMEYSNQKWNGSFDFSIESSHDTIIKTVKTLEITEKIWKVKKIVQKWLHDSHISNKKNYGVLSQTNEIQSNLFFIQIQAKSSFSIKLLYNSPKELLTSSYISDFDYKYISNFGMPISEDFEYNILGYLNSGLNYFQGSIQISTPSGNIKSEFGSLLSFVPSRVSFPRGFLWDEGFHLLISCNWNRKLCLEIFESWLLTMDENGWIPREQIRGAAAETRVPSQFLHQQNKLI